MPDVSAPSSQWWFRAAGTEKVYGPVSPEVLLGWAREGRVNPEDKVSPDNSSWGDARGLPFLAMDTVIVRPDGRVRQEQPDMVAEHEHIEPEADVQNATLVCLGKHGKLERRENGKIEERVRMHPLE